VIQLTHLWPPLLAALLTYIGLRAALALFPKWGLLDRPHEYGLTRQPIPYSGGLILFLAVIITTLTFVDVSRTVFALLIAATLIVGVSFWDDRRRLSPWLRLGVQILAALILVASGVQIQQISNPFGAPFFLDTIQIQIAGQTIWLLSALGITAWIVIMMNVMNWLDGIPGLTSGISTIAHAALYLLAIQQFHVVDQSAVITMASVLAAASAIFLIFDFHPPKILMGDTGSMFLGFMLAALSIVAGGKFATALLIMGFAVVDAIWVVLTRIFRGQSPIRGDLTHFHHRLLDAGLTERKALFLNYTICILFAAIALLRDTAREKFFALLAVLLIMTGVGLLLMKEESKEENADSRIN